MFERDIAILAIPAKNEEFLNNIFLGYSKSESLAMMRLSPIALDRALENDPVFQARLHRAEAYHADKMTDKLYTIHEDFEDPRMVSAVSENIKWLAKMRKRERYGEKLEHNIVQHIDITVAINDARKRVSSFIEANTLTMLDSPTDNISVEQTKSITNAPVIKPYVDPLS